MSGPETSTLPPAPATPAPGMNQGMATPYSFMPWMMPPPFAYPPISHSQNPFYMSSRSPRHSRSPPPRSSTSRRQSYYTSRNNSDLLSSPTMPSSDPPEEEDDNNPYPLITDLLERLDGKHPQRNFARHLRTFEEKDFFHIDEVASISVDRLSSDQFGFTAGNAQFFLDRVQKEIKRVDRASKQAAKEAKALAKRRSR